MLYCPDGLVPERCASKPGARFISDTDGKLIGTNATPAGTYVHPGGNAETDILQDSSQYNKIRGEDHGTTHTHPIDRNTGPTELSTPNEAKIHTDRLPKR